MPIIGGRGIAAALIAAAPLLAQTVPVKEHTLSNGMRLLLVERHDKPTVATAWIVRAGSANERPGMTGVAHLFEHMMFKGSKTIGTTNIQRDLAINAEQDKIQAEIRKEESILRQKELNGEIADMRDAKARSPRHQQLVEQMEKLVKEQQELLVKDEFSKIYTQAGGTGLNAFTYQDATCYHQTVPANRLELWAWMESDRLYQPVFREFYKERDVVGEERRMRTDSTPTGKFEETFEAMVWMAHPYHWPVIGWPSDVSSLTREQANEFFATYYAPNNLTAVLVGDFKSSEAIALCERYFGRIPANPKGVPEIITLEPKQLAEKRMMAEAETTPSAQIVYKAVSAGHKDAPALDVLSSVLNGRSGRLQKSLVEGQKVATRVRASMQGMKYGGTFVFHGTASADQKPEAVEQAIYREIEKIQKEGITEQELQKAKNQAQADSFRRLEDNMGLTIQLAIADATTGYQAFLDEPQKTEAVTREDVQRVAKDYLVKETRSVAIYTRKGGAAPTDPELAALPAEAQGMVKAQLGRLEQVKDPAQLKAIVGQLEGQAGQVPAEAKPVIDYMIKKVRERIAKLEAK
ncbi:MAG: insulinase family protein [Firmicutes bacterium]|nr:insulinase family protein [Bacillota bacterium]